MEQTHTYPIEQENRIPPQPRQVDEKVSAFLLRISDQIEVKDRDKRLRLYRQMIKTHKYADGNFYGYVNENCEWVDRERGEDERWYSDNQLYPYFRTALMEMNRTQTKVQIGAEGGDKELEKAAKFAQARYDANRDKTFNALLKQTENTYAVYNGITYRYTFFNFEGGRKEKIPKLQQQETSNSQNNICDHCGRAVPNTSKLDEFGEMAEPCACGNRTVKTLETPESSEIVVGYDDLPEGENKWTVPNPVAVIVSMTAANIDETPYLKWKQLILRPVLEEKYKGITLPSTGTESLELRYITNQQKSSPAETYDDGYTASDIDSNRADEGNELEVLELHQVWLDYPVYCNKTFDEDTKLANGKVLPANTQMGKMYPDGLYYAKVGDVVVDMWNENKNRKWTSSPYSLRAGSMFGAGSQVALPDQELINDQVSIEMANAWNNGVPREFTRPEFIKELSADPAVPTIVQGDTDKPIIGYAWERAPGVTLSPEFYQIKDGAKSSLQMKIGAMSNGAGGLADTEKWGDTATAISIKRDLAVGRFAPDLELMADNLDRKQAGQFLKNEQEYFTPPQWNRCKGDYDDEGLRAFLACDIDRDLTITIAPDSYMPKSEAQIMARFAQLLEILPLMQGASPEQLSYAFEVFGVPEHLGGWSGEKSHANRVIEKFTSLAELFVAQNGDAPDTDIQNPEIARACQLIEQYADEPVDLFLDNHTALIEQYKDWRNTDGGESASNILTAAIAFRVLKHERAIIQYPAMLKEMQTDAVQPLMDRAAEEQRMLTEGAAQVESVAAEAENAKAVEEAGRSEDMAILDKIVQSEEAEEQRQHEATEADKDRKNQIEIAKLKPATAQ